MQLPPPPPEQMDILRTTDPDLISFAYLRDACFAFGHWQVACGVDPTELQHPDTFVNEIDLNRFVSVVSRWPAAAPAQLRKPDLFMMVSGLRVNGNQGKRTFSEQLDVIEGNILRWMEANKVDPDNPNETAMQRKARLNRERVRAHRQRTIEVKSDDPVKDALAAEVRRLAISVQKGRAWAKSNEAEAKRIRDAAIEAAKGHCASTISAGRAAVAAEENRLAVAQAELDTYSIRK